MTITDKTQFVHIESYAREPSKKAKRSNRRTAAGVVAEVLREPSACPHITHPEAPEILWGDPRVSLNIAIDMAEQSYDSLGRRLRRDAAILAGLVCSYPESVAEIRVSPSKEAELQRWLERSVEWALDYFGPDHVGAAVLHMDEAMPHIHFLITPASPGLDPSPPRRAAKKALEQLTDPKKRGTAQRRAFVKEAERIQDSYFQCVSVHFGHTRRGVRGRPRMTREQRIRENSQALALKLANDMAMQVRRQTEAEQECLEQLQRYLHEVQQQARDAAAERDSIIRESLLNRRRAQEARSERDRCAQEAAIAREETVRHQRHLAVTVDSAIAKILALVAEQADSGTFEIVRNAIERATTLALMPAAAETTYGSNEPSSFG